MDDFPTVGLTPFDSWMTRLYFHTFKEKFLDIENFGCLDREHWKQYFDNDYSVEKAFEEDLTCYGD